MVQISDPLHFILFLTVISRTCGFFFHPIPHKIQSNSASHQRPLGIMKNHANNMQSNKKSKTISRTTLFMSSRLPAEFEMQELRAQLAGMKKAGISSSDLADDKRMEIESYVRSVATNCESPIALSKLGVGDTMVGTWRLAFSTEDAALTVLPKEARVFVKICDENGRGKMEYTLKFTKKVFALRSLTAKSYFEISVSVLYVSEQL